jgi:hypothetical protein
MPIKLSGEVVSMIESPWVDIALPLAGIHQLTDKLLEDLNELRQQMDLPQDEAGAEFVLLEAVIALHDAQETLSLADERYRACQKNWAKVRMKHVKDQRIKAEGAQKAAAEMNLQPIQQQAEISGEGPIPSGQCTET